jgi:hypothetical protein
MKDKEKNEGTEQKLTLELRTTLYSGGRTSVSLPEAQLLQMPSSLQHLSSPQSSPNEGQSPVVNTEVSYSKIPGFVP